ncbi:MAG: class I tRNA ligase family protein, partial [Clostridiales bacterium]|nr:class I tRNA ligase family protein [Clostridiales bacterium]
GGTGRNVQEEAFTACATGIMVKSGILNGLSVDEAKAKIIDWLTKEGKGHSKVNYKLRDWVFSRQRYWGEPIPIVYCEKCGYMPIDESELPLKLPMVESYEPTDNGESPLVKMTDWIETTCPHCGGKAKRETDTMPQWAGSSWYYLRYMDPHNDKELASKEALEYWAPVDWYNGGMEHTTLHLLYSRFWHKFLYDIGVVPTPEPYAKRTSHGMILGENGEKMSKSRGNVVNPDDIVDEYGADTMRLYEMFIGDFEKAAPWSQASIKGCRRFVERYWNLQTILIDGDKIRPELEGPFNKAIKKVGEDIENIKFNTAIATLMALINDISNVKSINREEFRTFSILLNPFAPHVTEEVYEVCKLSKGILAEESWPDYDESKCVDSTVEIVVQVNGKIKAKFNIPVDAQKDEILEQAKSDDNVKKAIQGMNIIKEIVVPKKLVNLVVKP